jgi:hypothetical protein
MGNKIIRKIIIKQNKIIINYNNNYKKCNIATTSLGTIDGSRRKFAHRGSYNAVCDVNVHVNLGNILIDNAHVNRREQTCSWKRMTQTTTRTRLPTVRDKKRV